MSCGWSENVNGQTNVNSCAKNGIDIVSRSEQSVCNGGNSHTCNNNQPQVINDQLSHGFAAFSQSGSCCKCYELTFTSGPVSGKKMIVQVNFKIDAGIRQMTN